MLRIILLSVSVLFAAVAQANADYHDTVPILRIGMLETHPAMADPLRIKTIEQAFSKTLDIPVEIIRFPDLAALVDAHASARVKYAIHTALSYAATESVCTCIRPFRRPTGSGGTSGFRSVLVMGKNTQRQPPVIAYSRQQSLSGWVIPREAMLNGSLPELNEKRAGSVAQAVAMLADGKADGIFGWLPEGRDDANLALSDRVFDGAYANELQAAGEISISWLSDPVYNGPHAVHRSLPDDMVEALARFLDEMPETAPGLLDIIEPLNSGGYQPALREDYQSLINLVAGMRKDEQTVTSSTPTR